MDCVSTTINAAMTLTLKTISIVVFVDVRVVIELRLLVVERLKVIQFRIQK